LALRGWAIAAQPDGSRFLLNGVPFEYSRYPISSPDLASIFWNIPTAESARFVCQTTITMESAFPDGFARLEFVSPGSDPEQSRSRAWYLPDPQNDLPMPSNAQIKRVIGTPDPFNYLVGGATTYKRLEAYLQSSLSKTFEDFHDILDFGCGSGRIARHFRLATQSRLWGVDIDADGIAWCRENLPHACFASTGILPPLPFPDSSFDLTLAISVLDQLHEAQQVAWLRELKRVTRKGGLIAIAVAGPAQIGLSRPPVSVIREIARKGFIETGRNPDLDDVMPHQTHYIRGLHSRDYIRSTWGREFSILDIVDALASNHDLIVMRNDRTPVIPADVSDPAVETASCPNPFAVPLRDYDINPVIHPMIMKTGYSAHLVDTGGVDYVDFMSAWGTNILGYGYRKVARAASRQAKRFNSLGLPYSQFEDFKALLRKIIPSAEEVRYGKNGSDACAGAVRLARFLTGREKILYRGYHGFHDWYFASTDCPGIPAALKSTVLPQSELSGAAVDAAFREHYGEIAGLILNPMTGPIPTAGEMRDVIDVVHSHGGLVIFDEMMTGLRVANGGMQELWNVQPDISCFGKSIANGLPLSVLCGKSEYIRRLPETYYGMTFEGEAVSIAGAFATVTEVVEKNVVAALYDKGRKIRQGYERLAQQHQLVTAVAGYEPCMHMDFQTQNGVTGRELLWLMIQQLVRNGIFTCGAFILSYSHSSRDLKKLEHELDSAMAVVSEAVRRGTTEGLLDERIRGHLNEIHAPAEWRQVAS
jgi:glutamate-1-semialdehyde aminotransferase/SAM-dependent methyltransferase